MKENAQKRTEDLKPIIEDIKESGVTSVRGIALELNQRGILTPRNKQWHATSVARLIHRLE